jgi:hypothetical protein
MKQNADFYTTVSGIPCGIIVDNYLKVTGSYSHSAPSDVDYHGFIERDWHVVDMKGYPAQWLQKKLTDKDFERIDAEVDEYMLTFEG